MTEGQNISKVSMNILSNYRLMLYQDKVERFRSEIVENCPKCNGTGLITDKKIKNKMGRPTDDIKLYLKNIRNSRKECKCQAKLFKTLSLIESNIPENLWNINRKTAEPKMVRDIVNKKRLYVNELITKYIYKMNEALDDGIGFVFFGPNGTGKTFFGSKILVNAINKKYSAHYDYLFNIIEMLKNFDDEFYEAVLNEIFNVDFLFLDEIGKEFRISQFALTNFEKILKERFSSKKCTILSTNINFNELKETYGGSIMSLINGSSLVLSFDGIPDLRVQKNRAKIKKFFE